MVVVVLSTYGRLAPDDGFARAPAPTSHQKILRRGENAHIHIHVRSSTPCDRAIRQFANSPIPRGGFFLPCTISSIYVQVLPAEDG